MILYLIPILVLAHILEVCRPIGVFSIGLFSIPLYLPILEVGAGPRCFAEGSAIFLGGSGSRAPRGNSRYPENRLGEVIFSYPCSSGICFGFIQILPKGPFRGGFTYYSVYSTWVYCCNNNITPGRFAGFFAYPHWSGPPRGFLLDPETNPRREVRSNVMTPEPELLDTTDFQRGQKTLSPRIGTTPDLTLGPSLFSRRSWKSGMVKCHLRILIELRTKGFV